MPESPLISVVIPCRNEADYIKSCLKSVLTQEDLPGDMEIIVADGLSDDGTREILARMAGKDDRIRVIDNPERYTSYALNHAIKAARGHYIIRMDVHTVYAPDYIHECLQELKRRGSDNIGGPWVARGDCYISKAIAAAFQSNFAAGGALAHDPTYEGPLETVYLGCWPRKTFEKFGLFDEELVRNQDDEHNLRIKRGGGTIWQSPAIRSWYVPRASLRRLFQQYRQYGFWKVRVIQKHKLPASIRHLVPGLFLAILTLSLGVTACGFIFGLFGQGSNTIAVIGLITFLSILFLYLVVSITASALTAFRTDWKYILILPAVFVCYHFGYGIGFMEGILNFLLLKKRGIASKQELTR